MKKTLETSWNEKVVRWLGPNDTIQPSKKRIVIYSPVTGYVTEQNGHLIIKPMQGRINCPCDGQIIEISQEGRKIVLAVNHDVQLTIGIGIDSFLPQGNFFSTHVREGEKVFRGDTLLVADLERMLLSGASTLVTIEVTQKKESSYIKTVSLGQKREREPLLEILEEEP